MKDMGIFSGKKEESKLILVFDLGSSSVGGAFFKTNKKGPAEMIFSMRESITFENEMDPGRFLFFALKTLEKVSGKASLAGFGRPDRIFCVLSSPWYASQTRVIKLKKNVPFVFTSKLADSLIQKEAVLFEKENESVLDLGGGGVSLVEFKNMKILLNGYETDDPYGKKCKELEMFIYLSMSQEKTLDRIRDSIFKSFHAKDIRFSTFTLASFAAVRDIFPHQMDFILMDICGEVTDISLVKKDALASSISFPLGRNFFIRKIALRQNCSLNEAGSLFSAYRDGHLGGSPGKKLAPFIKKLEEEWIARFEKSLEALSENDSLPSAVFVSADEKLSGFFGRMIRSEGYSQYSKTISKFKVIFLNPQILHKTVSWNTGMPRDSFLTVEVVYLDRFAC